jgi:hypothetical protein
VRAGHTRLRRAGSTLAELLVASTVALALVTLAASVLAATRRHATRIDARRQARAQLAQGAALLRAELRGASGDGTAPEGSDLRVARDTALELRVLVGGAVACAGSEGAVLELPAASRDDAPPFAAWGDAPQPGDVALVHDAGVQPGADDDTWHARAVTAVEAGECRTGPFAAAARGDAPRHRLRLDAALPLSVREGAPVRVLRWRRYALYRTGDGEWMLGQRAWEGAALAPPQPAAGPFADAAGGGFAVRSFDGAGSSVPAPAATLVAAVHATLRAERRTAGARWVDSTELAVRLRGTRPW